MVNICIGVISLFVNVFLLAQIFVLSGESFVALGVFSLLRFIFLFVFQIVGSVLCKKITPLFVIRLSTVLACLLLILIIFLQDHLIQFYMLFGLLWGCVAGLFLCASQFLVSSNADKEGALSFISIQVFFFSAANLVFPVTLGAVIYYGNFLITSAVILAIGVLQMLATLMIKNAKKDDARKQLDIKGYFKAIKKAGHLRPGLRLWFIIFLAGFSDTIAILATALVMLTFSTHLSLGVLTSFVYVFVMIISRLYKKISALRKYLYASAVILPLAGILLLVVFGDMSSVVLFMVFYRSTRNVIFMEEESTRLNAAKYWKGDAFIMESNLFYEGALAAGAVLSATLVIVIGTFYAQWLVILLLAITVSAFSLHGILLKLWQRRNAIP